MLQRIGTWFVQVGWPLSPNPELCSFIHGQVNGQPPRGRCVTTARASRVPWGRHRRPRVGFPARAPVLGVASRPRPAVLRAGWPRWCAMLMSLTLLAPAGRAARGRRADSTVGIPLQALDPAASREEAMPRSFLVKTHSSHRVPNYGKLETQRGRGWLDLCPQHSALRGRRQLGSPWELGHTCPR